MTKVWIVSALVVGAIVGGILLLTSEGSTDTDQPTAPELRPPARLQEKEVVVYMKVRPLEHKILQAAALEYAKGRKVDVREQLGVVLKGFHLTQSDWDRLRQRVEFVVGIQRWEENKKERHADLESRLRKQERLLEETPEDQTAMREKIKQDIEFFKNKLKATTRPIHDSDRKLTRRYWETLAPMVPSERGPVRPAKKPG